MEQNDLQLCVLALTNKNRAHTLRWRYYDGDHPIAFINPKIGEVVPNGVVFRKNWCQVVVDAKRNRLRIQTWNHSDKTIVSVLNETWKHTLKKTAHRIHLAALATGEAYLVAWPDDGKTLRAYYHDPRQAHVIYDENDPDKARVACKTWKGAVGQEPAWFLNLYYSDRIEHYASLGSEPQTHQAYRPYTREGTTSNVEANEYQTIPVFHFRLDQRVCTGELTLGVLSLQDALNKLLNDMMVSSEFAAFPQRWGIGNWETGSTLPVGPGTTATAAPSPQGDQPVAFGAFPSADPNNYLLPMNDMAAGIAVLSATPKHFFEGQGGAPSGEALQAMESPLVKKVEDYQEILGETWTRVAAFCLKVQDQEVPVEEIECIWTDPHTVQPMSQALIHKANVEAGIPITNQLRDEGWTEDDLDQLHEDMNVESSMSAAEVPAVGAFPQNIPENKRVAASTKAKDTLAARAEPGMAKVMQATVDKGVAGMMESGALGKIMEKHAGVKAGQ